MIYSVKFTTPSECEGSRAITYVTNVRAQTDEQAIVIAMAEWRMRPDFTEPAVQFIAEIKRHVGRHQWSETDTVFIDPPVGTSV